jgi:hypothetical protein
MQTYTALVAVIPESTDSPYQVSLFPDAHYGGNPSKRHIKGVTDLIYAVGLLGIQGGHLLNLLNNLVKIGTVLLHDIAIADMHLTYFGCHSSL